MTDFEPGGYATFANKHRVTIESGPWRNISDQAFYVVTMPEGWHFPAMEYDLTPDRVGKGDTRYHPVHGNVTIETDPVSHPRGAVVVVRTVSQHVILSSVGDLRPATEPGPDTVEVDGIGYRLDRRYRDAGGDVWTLARLDGEVYAAHGALLDAAHEITSDHWPWEDAVAVFGPMTEVAE